MRCSQNRVTEVPLDNSELNKNDKPHQDLYRVGFVSMLAIMLHNLPEGIATFSAGYENLALGNSNRNLRPIVFKDFDDFFGNCWRGDN